MPRKSTKTNIDPISLCCAALNAVKVAADYHTITNTEEPEVFQEAWSRLTESERQRITQIVNAASGADPQAIANELAGCETMIQLQVVKTHYGESLVKSAWKLLTQEERDRILGNLSTANRRQTTSGSDCKGCAVTRKAT